MPPEGAELRQLITDLRTDIRDWRQEMRTELDGRVRLDLYQAEIAALRKDIADLESSRRAALPVGAQVLGVLAAIAALILAAVNGGG